MIYKQTEKSIIEAEFMTEIKNPNLLALSAIHLLILFKGRMGVLLYLRGKS